MFDTLDISKSLEEIEGIVWGEPEAEASALVRQCHLLRKVPLRELRDDDLRLLLGQQIGSHSLMPLALDRLLENPLAGDLYPGDLLNAVLRTDPDYWVTNPGHAAFLWEVRSKLKEIEDQAIKMLAHDNWPSVDGQITQNG